MIKTAVSSFGISTDMPHCGNSCIISTRSSKQKARICSFGDLVPTGTGKNLQQIEQESIKITSLLKANDLVILLDVEGAAFTNQQFAELLENELKGRAKKCIVFIIGGAFGVSKELKDKANIIWSLSNLVFPHQIVRLILMEQVYRTSMILQNHPYHHK